MSEGFAIAAGVLFLAGMGVLFYAGFRGLWQREQEYKAQWLAERAAAGLLAPTRAGRVRESIAAVIAASGILSGMIYFGSAANPLRALFLALAIVYGWRWFRGRGRARWSVRRLR